MPATSVGARKQGGDRGDASHVLVLLHLDAGQVSVEGGVEQPVQGVDRLVHPKQMLENLAEVRQCARDL
jgi:hypothetical protein